MSNKTATSLKKQLLEVVRVCNFILERKQSDLTRIQMDFLPDFDNQEELLFLRIVSH